MKFLKSIRDYVSMHISELLLSGILAVPLFIWQVNRHNDYIKSAAKEVTATKQDILEGGMLLVLLMIIYILFLIWITQLPTRFHGSKLISIITLILVPIANFFLIVKEWQSWHGMNLIIIFSTFALSYVLVFNLRAYLSKILKWIMPNNQVNYKRTNLLIGIVGILFGLLAGKL